MIRRLVVACACLALTTLGTGGAASAGDLARGKVLFHYCTQCHGDAGGGSQLAQAPAIAGLGDFMLLLFSAAAPDVMKAAGANWEKPAWLAEAQAVPVHADDHH